MLDELLLLSGNDIPFIEANLIIHQPRIKQIAYITEQRFWMGSQFMTFDKEKHFNNDTDLNNQTNFSIIMSILGRRDEASQETRIDFISLLTLLFPMYELKIKPKAIELKNNQTYQSFKINADNFDKFQKIISEIFCLGKNKEDSLNPQGQLAKKIAKKIQGGQQRRAQLAPDANKKVSILSRYISILAVGQGKNINDLMDYTVYQLMDEFERFQLKLHYDTWLRYRIAGATGMEDPEDWYKDIH